MNDPIVGIDLGTSNTVVAHAGPTGTVTVLGDASGFKIHPSVVSFHPTGGVVVGAAAKQRKVIDPKNTIYSVKRLIGRSYSSKEVQTAKQRSPFVIKEGANQLPLVVTRAGEFAVPEISAIVLDHAKNVAKAALATPVSRAVVTVPASFNDAQRSATATAGSIAGLEVLRVINEPTAAALAYGNTRNLRETIAVYDFGGGTFDITILKLGDQVYEVLGSSGDTFLGGDDLDERLVDRMVEKFLMENRVDLRQNEVSMMRLRAVAEQVKIELSRRSRAMVRIDEIAYGPKGKPLDLQIEIRRDELIRQVADIIDRTFPVCEEALKLANLTIDHVDDVILVGGTTKIPYVRDQVAKFFAKAPRTDVNPEDAVAVGAALQARALQRTRKPSRQVPVQAFEESTFDGETASKDTVTYAEPPAMAELPMPQVSDDHDLLEPTMEKGPTPSRQTAAYPQVLPPPTPKRAGERSVERPAHKDVFEDRTPPPVSPNQPVIGRLTKQITPPASGKPPPTAPRTATQPVPVMRPAVPSGPHAKTIVIPSKSEPSSASRGGERGPASTLRGLARVHDDEDTGGFRNEPTNTSIADLDLGFPELPTTKDPVPPSTTARGFAAASSQRTQALPLVAPRPPASASRGSESTPTMNAAAAPVSGSHDASTPMPGAYGAAPSPPIVAAPAAPTLVIAPQPNARQPNAPAPSSPPSSAPPSGAPLSSARPPIAAQAVPIASHAPASPMMPSPVVIDVTPRSLGIGTVAGFCEELIRRNSRVPTEIRKLFTTSRDRQASVRIVVCQGESRRLDSNVVIGDLLLEDLPPRPRGETSIEVTFALDASGILQVRARDAQTGREQRASLDIVGSLPEEDVTAAREKLQALRR